jgi:ABC-type nitrate/sulfonate/bicarbonate transport system permease component
MSWSRAWERTVLPVGLLLAWELGARLGLLPRYLSMPSAILTALVQLALDGDLFGNLIASLYRAYVGFLIGAALGVFLGLWAGLARPVRNFFDPLVSFLYPIPKIAFLPVVFLIFGLGHGSQIAVITIAVFFPVFIASQYAVLSVNRTFLWAARNMGAPRATIFLRVLIPAAAPQLLAGLRVGLAHSFVLLFAAELIGARSGLGFLIMEGEEAVRFDRMLAGIVMFAVIGFISDRALMAARHRLLRGQTIGTQEQVP